MAMSENSVKILNYLKDNAGKNLTSADVAEALDLGKATVNGAFTAMQKKGLGVRVDAEVPGAVEVSFLTITDEGRAADISEMGETVNKIINYLADTTDNTTLDDLATAIGVEKRSVNGSFNALVKKGLCARTPAKVEAMVPVKYLALTDAGMAFDPTADAE
jgi:DNA-binding IclR family transcriptional regulator